MLGFEMAQDVLQPILDAAEIGGAGIGGRSPAVPADRTRAVRDGRRRRRCRCRPACGRCGRTTPAARSRDIRNCRRGRPLAVFQRRGQRGDALFERAKNRRAFAARELVDLRRQRVHVVGQAAPARRWRRHWRRWREARRSRLRAAGRWRDRHCRAGSGRAWRRDCGSPRHSRRAVRPASASAALRGFRERAFDPGQRLAVAAALAGLVDAAGQRADFVLDRFDRPARHRLGDGVRGFPQVRCGTRRSIARSRRGAAAPRSGP